MIFTISCMLIKHWIHSSESQFSFDCRAFLCLNVRLDLVLNIFPPEGVWDRRAIINLYLLPTLTSHCTWNAISVYFCSFYICGLTYCNFKCFDFKMLTIQRTSYFNPESIDYLLIYNTRCWHTRPKKTPLKLSAALQPAPHCFPLNITPFTLSSIFYIILPHFCASGVVHGKSHKSPAPGSAFLFAREGLHIWVKKFERNEAYWRTTKKFMVPRAHVEGNIMTLMRFCIVFERLLRTHSRAK